MLKYMKPLISAFLNGSDAYAKSAHVEDNIFYSYSTPIALNKNGHIYLTMDKFSRTTTTQQKAIADGCSSKSVSLVSHSDIINLITE